MDKLLIIVISLLLGFYQGLKKRNKKMKMENEKLKLEIASLKDEINNFYRKERLQQYQKNGKRKADRYETDLTQFISESNDNKDLLIYAVSYIKYLCNININIEQYINIADIYVKSRDLIESIENKRTDQSMVVDLKTHKKLCYTKDVFEEFSLFDKKMDLDCYEITYEDMIKISDFLLENMV